MNGHVRGVRVAQECAGAVGTRDDIRSGQCRSCSRPRSSRQTCAVDFNGVAEVVRVQVARARRAPPDRLVGRDENGNPVEATARANSVGSDEDGGAVARPEPGSSTGTVTGPATRVSFLAKGATVASEVARIIARVEKLERMPSCPRISPAPLKSDPAAGKRRFYVSLRNLHSLGASFGAERPQNRCALAVPTVFNGLGRCLFAVARCLNRRWADQNCHQDARFCIRRATPTQVRAHRAFFMLRVSEAHHCTKSSLVVQPDADS
jgi:hypothetical protein